MTQLQVHILVVDDERNIRNNLRMVLEVEGYKVATASNGDDALLRVKERYYDIAFVDIQMSKMGGLELLGVIAEQAGEDLLLGVGDLAVVLRVLHEALRLGARASRLRLHVVEDGVRLVRHLPARADQPRRQVDLDAAEEVRLEESAHLEECLPRSEYWDVPVDVQTEETAPPRVLRFLQSSDSPRSSAAI